MCKNSLLRTSVCVLIIIVLLPSMSITKCRGQADTSDCIIFAKPDETYLLEIEELGHDERLTIPLRFNYEDSIFARLETDVPYLADYSPLSGLYSISNASLVLCAVAYLGKESVLMGIRAKLRIMSDDFSVRLAGVRIQTNASELTAPESAKIVIAIVSILPFFLLIPDVLEDLRLQLEHDGGRVGVYRRILELLLPLLVIALTYWLLTSLSFFG